MKTSDLGAYQHIESITGTVTAANYRAFLVNPTNTSATATISGTTWEKDSSGNYKTFTNLILRSSTGDSFVVPISVRSISALAVSNCTLWGLR
jgi:hypothetical protein